MKFRGERTASPSPVVVVGVDEAPEISFVTVTYGTGPIVIEMLRSLAESLPADTRYEVIVVDNPHPTGRGRTLRHLRLDTAGVNLIRPETNVGFGSGCELGAWHSRSRVVAFVNPDLVFEPGWLPPALEALDEPGVSIVAPVLLEPDGRVQEAGGRVTPLGWTLPITVLPDEAIADVEYASAACWLMSAYEHERSGGFDPAFAPAYFEDVDLALRTGRLGGRCVVATRSRIVHRRGSSTPDAPVSDDQHEVFVERWPLVAWRAGAIEAQSVPNTVATTRRA